jgi:hypothetical protein
MRGAAVTNEYADVPALKLARRIGKDDDDAALLDALTAASRAIDKKTGRRFWLDETTTARTMNPRRKVVSEPDGERLLIADVGDATGLLVERGYGSSWTPVTGWETEPEDAPSDGWAITSLFLPYGYWGTSIGLHRIRITARWGWPAIPDEIRRATLLLANRLYLRKDSPEGVSGTAEWGAVRMSRVDPDVEALISPYTLPGFA